MAAHTLPQRARDPSPIPVKDGEADAVTKPQGTDKPRA